MSQRQCSVKLRKRFAAGFRLYQANLANPFRKISTSEFFATTRFRINGESAHKRTPRKLTSSWHIKDAIWWRIQRRDRSEVRCQFLRQEVVYLRAKLSS